MTTLKIVPIPALLDNYIWTITSSKEPRSAVVIDPCDASLVLQYLEKEGLRLSAILITHGHHDHTDGVDKLKEHFPDAVLIAPKGTTKCAPDLTADEGIKYNFIGEDFLTIALPGHTIDHVGYKVREHLFCGDVIFSAGCGRVESGLLSKMLSSIQRINNLPDNTLLYPAHEYTINNLKFAQSIEPDNFFINTYLSELRKSPIPKITLPTTLIFERRINPFLRCETPKIISAASETTDSKELLDIFSAIRTMKDNF